MKIKLLELVVVPPENDHLLLYHEQPMKAEEEERDEMRYEMAKIDIAWKSRGRGWIKA